MPFRPLLAKLRSLYWVRFTMEIVRRFNDDQCAVLAGYISYASMLAAFPFLIFAMALAGSIIGQTYSEEAFTVLFDAVPEHVALTLEPVLREVIGEHRGGVLTVSALGAIYGASNGVEAIRIGLDRAYDVEMRRNFLVNRLISIGFVFIGIFVFSTLALLIIFAPLAISMVEQLTTFDVPAEADLARYLIGAVLLYMTLWSMHRILPDRSNEGMIFWPGVLISMVLWVLAATALSIYVANTPSYTITYGALAGVVVTLLFFYLTGVAIIFGAQVNAVVNFGVPPLTPPIPEPRPDQDRGS
ncbi:MAG: YihY/virulence factor BrkB family protein [Pseudomonadota bacterium]